MKKLSLLAFLITALFSCTSLDQVAQQEFHSSSSTVSGGMVLTISDPTNGQTVLSDLTVRGTVFDLSGATALGITVTASNTNSSTNIFNVSTSNTLATNGGTPTYTFTANFSNLTVGAVYGLFARVMSDKGITNSSTLFVTIQAGSSSSSTTSATSSTTSSSSSSTTSATSSTTSSSSSSTSSVTSSTTSSSSSSTTPEIAVYLSGTELTDGSGSIDFGTMLTNTTAITTNLVITNLGTATLNVSGFTLAGSGLSLSGTNFATIAASNAKTVTLSFDPSTAVANTGAALTINSDDADEASYDLTVSATATNAASGGGFADQDLVIIFKNWTNSATLYGPGDHNDWDNTVPLISYPGSGVVTNIFANAITTTILGRGNSTTDFEFKVLSTSGDWGSAWDFSGWTLNGVTAPDNLTIACDNNDVVVVTFDVDATTLTATVESRP